VYLFLSVDTLLVTLVGQFKEHPKFCYKRGAWLDILAMIGHQVLVYQLGFFPWILSTWVMSVYLFGNFSLSHTHLPVTSDPTHWVEYSLVHTADISGGFPVDWWMGYLNYQVRMIKV